MLDTQSTLKEYAPSAQIRIKIVTTALIIMSTMAFIVFMDQIFLILIIAVHIPASLAMSSREIRTKIKLYHVFAHLKKITILMAINVSLAVLLSLNLFPFPTVSTVLLRLASIKVLLSASIAQELPIRRVLLLPVDVIAKPTISGTVTLTNVNVIICWALPEEP